MTQWRAPFWYYPLMALLLLAIFRHVTLLVAMPLPNFPMKDSDAASPGSSQSDIQQRKQTLKKAPGSTDFLLGHWEHTIKSRLKDSREDPCNSEELNNFPYEPEHFEKVALELQDFHDAEYIEGKREPAREWAKLLLERGRITFDVVPPALQDSLLKHGYVPPSKPVADVCASAKLKS